MGSVAEELNFADVQALYAAVGEHYVSAASVAAKVSRILTEEPDSAPEVPQLPVTARKHRRTGSPGSQGVHVEGLDDVMIRLSRCCTPVPGDEIIGFVTRGRGVSVHRSDCANAVSLSSAQNDRVIEVEWAADSDADHFVASVSVKAYDRSQLLSDLSAVFAEQHINIIGSSTVTDHDRIASFSFDFEIVDPSHLKTLLFAIRKIDGVFDAFRVLPGARG